MSSIATFCGTFGWIVMLQAALRLPWLPVVYTEDDTVCLITQAELSSLRSAVVADDGYVYHAKALREWLRRCADDERPPCVIPSKEIAVVRPVRIVQRGKRCLLTQPFSCDAVSTVVDATTQTESPRPRRRTQAATKLVRIPSAHSAFRPVVPKAACAPR